MSQIVTAIDAELTELDEQLAEAENAVRTLTDRKHGLAKLRLEAVELNGGPPPARAEKAKVKAKPKKAPAPQVSDGDREARHLKAEDAKRRVLAFVRKHGQISAPECAELLDISVASAAERLRRYSSTTELTPFDGERTGRGRPPKLYRIEFSTPKDGPKTQVEERVVDSVTTDGPIDEGTLAFNCNLSITDCRSVTSGLVRRGVLTKREEEGVTLFEVAA